MEKKKFVFVVSHAAQNPAEAIVMMKIATNMKAFDDDAEINFFLMGEGVKLAQKGVAETISMELEGQNVVVGDMLKTLTEDFGVRFFVCHAFMPTYGVTRDTLIDGSEMKSSSYLGELLLDGYTPLQFAL